MAPRDRLSALKLMDRIKQHELETIGAELANLRAVQKSLDDESAALKDTAVTEARESTEHTRQFLPAYLKSVETRQNRLAEQRRVTEEDAAQAEDMLLSAFKETKTTEQVLKRVEKEIALDVSRSSAVEMDDATRSLYALHRQSEQKRKEQ